MLSKLPLWNLCYVLTCDHTLIMHCQWSWHTQLANRIAPSALMHHRNSDRSQQAFSVAATNSTSRIKRTFFWPSQYLVLSEVPKSRPTFKKRRSLQWLRLLLFYLWLLLTLFCCSGESCSPKCQILLSLLSPPLRSAALSRDAPQPVILEADGSRSQGPEGPSVEVYAKRQRGHVQGDGRRVCPAVMRGTCSPSPETLWVHHGGVELSLLENRNSVGRGARLVFAESNIGSSIWRSECAGHRETSEHAVTDKGTVNLPIT